MLTELVLHAFMLLNVRIRALKGFSAYKMEKGNGGKYNL